MSLSLILKFSVHITAIIRDIIAGLILRVLFPGLFLREFSGHLLNSYPKR